MPNNDFADELDKLAEAATPGEWESNCLMIKSARGIIAQAFVPQHGGTFDPQQNVWLIVYLVNHAEQIAAVVRALQAEVDNCANCSGAGTFIDVFVFKKCKRCTQSRQALAALNAKGT